MKKMIYGVLISLGITTAIVIKKVNDDREVQELANEDGIKFVRKETFKEVIKRKINKILKWVGDNPEKVENFTKAAAAASAIIGIVSSTFGLYSSIKSTVNNNGDVLLDDIAEIKMRLLYLTPDVEVSTF